MKVSVIGATGTVGSAAAFYIAASNAAREIVMIDIRENVLHHHAMDIGTAVASLDVSVKAGGFEDMAGSQVVINAAGIHQVPTDDRKEALRKNIPIVTEIAMKVAALTPAAVVINATNPVDPLNYAAWRTSGLDRRQLIGYCLNDSLRFRELVARARGARVSTVKGMVIGEHGKTQVPLFSSVKIEGQPASFSEGEKRALRDQAPGIVRRYDELGADRTAGWTCAVGLATLTRAILEDTGEVFPCSIVLDGEFGLRQLSMGVPVALGKQGAQEVLEWDLAPDEQASLELTANTLKTACTLVDEMLAQHTL